ncbi:MBOAT, membrane-bound o-acyltransferase family domain-containing protein [Ditylenchus destructor]|uniref:MBOAT, membrane-bound o-acyltransferase family domain-containing protein n=1 Tax=Ditylenchus destructor TaxID=166010 RepID=A0AAD4MW75_9BILA|nr:MBOAT, membrane-bound o-acyltransferase family domain-containing protein [Ditylenchus destructor]
MPGLHTFYDGTTILEPLAQLVGFEVDKLNLVFCQLASFGFAWYYSAFLSPATASRTVRLAYPLIVGVSLCYFCYGSAIKHIFGNVAICYAIMRFSPPQYVHKFVFIFSMGYLVFIHWFRWYIMKEYYIDVTGPIMVIVQKTTTLAFSLHDGRMKKPEELNEIQKREAISEVPNLLDYLSYLLSFQTILTGPLCFYTDYQKFITGENLAVDKAKTPNPLRPAITKLAYTVIFLLMLCYFGLVQAETIMEPEYFALPWYKWWPLFWFVIFMQRVQYYYAWTLADAVCNMSGFGFNGYDEQGNERWDLVTNVDPWKVETALSFKDTLDGWNITTMYWLRRVAYDRVKKNYRTISTYLLSATWHGFFIGYYMTFLTGAIVTVAGRNVRRCVRHRFQSTEFSRRLYDAITFIATKTALMYTTFPFVTMHLYPGIELYRRLHFFLHILGLFAIIALPRILPPPPRTRKEEDVRPADDKKEL